MDSKKLLKKLYSFLKSILKVIFIIILLFVLGLAGFLYFAYYMKEQAYKGMDESRISVLKQPFSNDELQNFSNREDASSVLGCYKFNFKGTDICFDRSRFTSLRIYRTKASPEDSGFSFVYVADKLNGTPISNFYNDWLGKGGINVSISHSGNTPDQSIRKWVNFKHRDDENKNKADEMIEEMSDNEGRLFDYSDYETFVSLSMDERVWTCIENGKFTSITRVRDANEYWKYRGSSYFSIRGTDWKARYYFHSNDSERINGMPASYMTRLSKDIEKFIQESIVTKSKE